MSDKQIGVVFFPLFIFWGSVSSVSRGKVGHGTGKENAQSAKDSNRIDISRRLPDHSRYRYSGSPTNIV